MTAQPPVARRIPVERTHHGDTFVDEYAWLAGKDDPETVAYLTAENEHTKARTADQAQLRDTIFNEIMSRTQETDVALPQRKGGYWYYTRTVAGKQYPIHCRAAIARGETAPPTSTGGAPLSGEEILLDGNVEAGDSAFFDLGTYDVSPDGRLLAYSVDLTGDERFTLKVRDLKTGENLPDEVPGVHYGSAWSSDSTTLFYLRADDAWRAHQVWRHRLGATAPAAGAAAGNDALPPPDAQPGTPPGTEDIDTLVYEEPDQRFSVDIGLTRSQRWLVLSTGSIVTSECYLVPADRPGATPLRVRARRQGVEYHVEHDAARDRFLILHNDSPSASSSEERTLAAGTEDRAVDFALSWVPEAELAQGAEPPWRPLIPHTPGQRLLDVDAFAAAVVVSLRSGGLTAVRVLPAKGAAYDIAFPEPLYTVGLGPNLEYETDQIRISYASMITPPSLYDYDLRTRDLVLRWQRPVPGGFDPARYEQHREWATASDGTRIPVSIACRRGTPRDGSAPLLLYGYGSYEASMDPWFSVGRLSLLDRGVVYAVAHVRGGGEMGRHWYEDGKLLAKRNTFTDFIACAHHLVAAGWSSTDRVVAMGGSAGGLLMGAVANLEPTAFAGIVAQVPFVDVLTTILDPSLPLTVAEWEEWGDPVDDAEAYRYIKSYAPYENLSDRPYPPMLILGSLNDTRVLYHEPAKYVARLRAVAPATEVLLKTEMGTGHGGPSGRYDSWREEAFILAWILTRLGAAR